MEIVVENLLLNLSKNIKELLLENSKRKPYRKSYKNNFRKQHKKPETAFQNQKDITCFKCGKRCHTKNFYKLSKKLQELELKEETS